MVLDVHGRRVRLLSASHLAGSSPQFHHRPSLVPPSLWVSKDRSRFPCPHGQGVRKNAGASNGEVSAGLEMSVLQATNGHFAWGRSGFSTGHPDWELCYAASIDARRLADDEVFNWKNWELSVWQKDRYHRWTVREIWRHQDPFLCAKAIEIMKACLHPLIFEDPR